jgi:hypothetical protein
VSLLIEMPAGCESERIYITQVILKEFLGLNYKLQFMDSLQFIRITSGDGRELTLQDIFFKRATNKWLGKDSMPELPLLKIRLSELPLSIISQYDDLPVLYGKPVVNGELPITISDSKIDCYVDVIGSCFFLLSRYEEAVSTERDQYDRFPYSASILSQEMLVSRPLVNEYVELLWSFLSRLWPALTRSPRSYRLMLTHDVDWPLSMPHLGIIGLCKKITAALLVYRSLGLAWRRAKGFTLAKLGYYDVDPFNTFGFIMDTAERYGVRSAFYFITDHTAGLIDGVYTMRDPWIRKLLRTIHDRGHEIGLHGSFNTYTDQNQTEREVGILRAICAEEHLVLGAIGGRQHYLRWSALNTWDIWDQLGLAYDSTLGFAEHVGFRAGTCYEYTVYSLSQRTALALKERPMIVMDSTLTGAAYMDLSLQSAMPIVLELIKTCRFYRGDFTCLFHNSSLESEDQKRFFSDVVANAV